MENRAAKRREIGDADAVADDDVVGSDRISKLPESVLLHILCFVSHKKAIQTSVLSKSWRHLGPNRPVIHIRAYCGLYHYLKPIGAGCEECFNGNNEAFISVLEETLQRYHDHNLFTQEVDLQMLYPDSQSIRLLEKWIPIFINPDKPAVTMFGISFDNGSSFSRSYFNRSPFNLPSVVFKAESLLELHLSVCRIDSIDEVVLKNLQKITLFSVKISDEALEKIISGCPLVKCVDLYQCEELKTINIGNKNHHHLNNFEHFSFNGVKPEISIEIDAPTLQSISVVRCWDWHRTHNNYFPNLKSLFLVGVKLPMEESFVNFSCNFPRLEELKLESCSGFNEIKLYSCSIKRLIIHEWRPINKVDVEVPNILYFEFSSSSLSGTLSLTTTSTKWKSHLILSNCVYDEGDTVFPRILHLFKMVKALSQSQITLRVSESFDSKMKQMKWNFNDHPAVVVEHLSLDIGKLCPDSLTRFLNILLCIFRPRYINAVSANRKDDEEFIECLWKTLMHKIKMTKYRWDQHLEEVSIEASDQNGTAWHLVQLSRLPEWSKNRKIRFRLKWNDY